MRVETAIIGAGVAGLTAASCLGRRGVETVVLDKARGAGGRASTRRDGELRFDHGAQYFTCRSAEFLAQTQRWTAAGVVAPWQGRIVSIGSDGRSRPLNTERTRFVGVPGMNAVVQALAQDANVRYRAPVAGLRREGAWHLSLENGELIEADTLIIAMPPSQAAALLADTDTPLRAELEKIEMAPCWAVLAAFVDALNVPFDGAFVNGGPLSWIAHDSSKPGRTTEHCWVLHAAYDWSEAHLEDNAGSVGQVLLRAFTDLLGNTPKPLKVIAHRWRYAQAIVPLSDGPLKDPGNRLIVAGDWCAGSRIEGAYLAGRAAAAAIKKPDS